MPKWSANSYQTANAPQAVLDRYRAINPTQLPKAAPSPAPLRDGAGRAF